MHVPITYTGLRTLPPGFAHVGRLTALARRERAALVHANDVPSFQPAGYAARWLGCPRRHPCPVPGFRDGIQMVSEAGLSPRAFRVWRPRERCDPRGAGSLRDRSDVVYDGVRMPDAPDDAARRALRQELGLPADGIVVALTGQVAEVKGIWEFIDAAEMLVRRGVPVSFAVLGDDLKGKGALRRGGREDRGVARTHRSRALPRISAQRAAPDSRLRHHRGSFAHRAAGQRDARGHGRGRPVIGSRVGGIPEMVVDGETGLLVESRNATALAAAIESLVRDPDRAHAFGRAGRARAEQVFSVAAHANHVQAVYDRLLATPPAPMTVLYLTNNPQLAGTARILTSWVGLGREHDIRACVAVQRPGQLADWLGRNDVPFIESSMPWLDLRWPIPALWEAWRLARWARRQGASIVHCNEHDVYPFGALVAALDASARGVPRPIQPGARVRPVGIRRLAATRCVALDHQSAAARLR